MWGFLTQSRTPVFLFFTFFYVPAWGCGESELMDCTEHICTDSNNVHCSAAFQEWCKANFLHFRALRQASGTIERCCFVKSPLDDVFFAGMLEANAVTSRLEAIASGLEVGWRPFGPSLLGWRPSRLGWRPSLVGWRPSLLGWRPSLVGWRPLLLGWRPLLLGWRPSLVGWGPSLGEVTPWLGLDHVCQARDIRGQLYEQLEKVSEVLLCLSLGREGGEVVHYEVLWRLYFCLRCWHFGLVHGSTVEILDIFPDSFWGRCPSEASWHVGLHLRKAELHESIAWHLKSRCTMFHQHDSNLPSLPIAGICPQSRSEAGTGWPRPAAWPWQRWLRHAESILGWARTSLNIRSYNLNSNSNSLIASCY